MKRIRGWLDRPQRSNRDAVVVGLVGGVLTAAVLYGAGELLDLVALVDFGGSTPAWLLAVTAGAALALGLLLGRAASGASELANQVHSLEARTDELAGYEVYAEHLRDALETLRQLLDLQLPSFSLADYKRAQSAATRRSCRSRSTIAARWTASSTSSRHRPMRSATSSGRTSRSLRR